MKALSMRILAGSAAAACCLLQACPSAYQRTYEQQTRQLEMQQQAAQAQAAAEHAQASKYAAVVYFEVGSNVIGAEGAVICPIVPGVLWGE